jgi:DNA mismatch repair ATPase MutS
MERLGRIVSFVDARQNEFFALFVSPVLLWDVHCAVALEAWRARAGKAASSWFSALSEMEGYASLATFAFENPDYAYPELSEKAVYEAEALGHPLLRRGVRRGNDVSLEQRGSGLVITGSNMSGKSTLLRALGTNAVLARTGAPVCAKKLVIGHLVVATSMRVRDSLDEGVSRFYAELKKLKVVLDTARTYTNPSGPALFYLLDEILHGTNTRERLIGARAIVKELCALGAMGAVSTHDLALGDLEAELGGRMRNVHFEEQVEGDVMSFDYALRQGVVKSSNALRLMHLVGLDVIAPDDPQSEAPSA